MEMRHPSPFRALLLVGISITLCIPLTLAIAAQPAAANIAGCPMFPTNNVWNTRVDSLPVHPMSSAYIASIGATTGVHPDFGAGLWQGAPIGIPYTTVLGMQPLVSINYTDYGDESDPGPFPIPPNAPIEGGPSSTGDRHVLVVDTTNCKLYELFNAYPQQDGSWNASAGAVFTLTVNAPLRPDTWTSADAAGLPILPGLARYDEVATGAITHALRFTARCSRGYIWPARHRADTNATGCATPPPMGQRIRLKASFVINPSWDPQVKVILTALKTYGMILADNGSSWYISGAPDASWNDDALVNQLRNVRGSDFEAVMGTWLMVDYNSGEARIPMLNARLWIPLIRR